VGADPGPEAEDIKRSRRVIQAIVTAMIHQDLAAFQGVAAGMTFGELSLALGAASVIEDLNASIAAMKAIPPDVLWPRLSVGLERL
jgi:hypothetical protein